MKQLQFSQIPAPLLPDAKTGATPDAKTGATPDAKTGATKGPQKRGHAGIPGTGPEGETCGTCAHCARLNHAANAYHKCLLCRPRWTHGPGTDIRKRDAACSFWRRDQ